jgi:hypothetical protein
MGGIRHWGPFQFTGIPLEWHKASSSIYSGIGAPIQVRETPWMADKVANS